MKTKEKRYVLYVGNIGRIGGFTNKKIAESRYREYALYSKKGYGRAAGETVTLYDNGHIIKEHEPVKTNE